MAEELEPIKRIDWRYRVATTVAEDHREPDGEIVYAKGTPITLSTFVKHGDREIGFGDPSATALFLSQSYKSFTEAMRLHPFQGDWPPRGSQDTTARVYDYLELICGSIIFAYTALEAFVNEELPEGYTYEREEQTDSGVYVVRQFDKEQIERQLSLSEKLATVLPQAMGKSSPKGTSPWEGFVHLRRLRDRVVHMKSEDRKRSKGHEKYPESIWRDLLNPNQRDYPSIAKSMVLHFKQEDTDHWLRRCPF